MVNKKHEKQTPSLEEEVVVNEGVEVVKPLPTHKWIFTSLWDGIKRLGLSIWGILVMLVKSFLNIFVYAYKAVIWLAKKIYGIGRDFVMYFIKGSWKTKISYLFMGVGHFFRKRPLKAILYLVIQAAFIVYMVLPQGGGYWLSKFDNLGDIAYKIVEVPNFDPITGEITGVIEQTVFRDNSMLIMLYSVLTLVIIAAFAFTYFKQIKGQYLADQLEKQAQESLENRLAEFNKHGTVNGIKVSEAPVYEDLLPTPKQEFDQLLYEKFHLTTLAIPSITVMAFTILPLIFMILLAFTNYDSINGPPSALFTWTGLATFKRLFTDKVGGFSVALGSIFKWTITWAFFATFTNYIGGMILALMINKKGIHLKKLWRTVFVITIAVPQFVTLLLMSKMLSDYGPLNETLQAWGWIDKPIRFLSNKDTARVTVILVNMWIGIPYTMLITSGILMNIPDDLYESARIDGAGPVIQFFKITLPYMLFVTGPYLITQFIGNINNFNVIFFLTGGGPNNPRFAGLYGETDILVTWLYKLTVGGAKQEYAIGSALGIVIFLVSAFISLMLYSRTSAATSEGDFA